MTVKELIVKLLDQDMDAVVLVPPSPDEYGHTLVRDADLLYGFASNEAYANPHDWHFDPRGCPDGSYVPAVVLLEEVY